MPKKKTRRRKLLTRRIRKRKSRYRKRKVSKLRGGSNPFANFTTALALRASVPPLKVKRYLKAQAGKTAHRITFDQALQEIKVGRKQTHWIWYIFPTPPYPGSSPINKYYALGTDPTNLQEHLALARQYLEHPDLGSRLIEITLAATQQLVNFKPSILFGSRGDVIKFKSCMELFSKVDETGVFSAALDVLAISEEPHNEGLRRVLPPTTGHRRPVFSMRALPMVARVRTPQVETMRYSSQDIALQFQGKRIGVLVASNAGRPGGSLGSMDGTGLANDYRKSFRTQEESVVASWLRAEEQKGKGLFKKKFDANKVFRKNLGIQVTGGRPWGLIYPDTRLGKPGSTHTIQGIDFTIPFFDEDSGESMMEQALNYGFAYTLREKPIKIRREIVIVDLVFVYGPNVAFSGKHTGSGARTKVKHYRYRRDYLVFRESVKTALRAGLLEMIQNRDQIAILALVSGGIYVGKGTPTQKHLLAEYELIINEILSETYKRQPIGYYFERIILPRP